MTDNINVTYRLVDLTERVYGQTATSRRFAMVSLGQIDRSGRSGLDRTDWDNSSSRPKAFRTVLIDIESYASEWSEGGPD